jgi:diamine N-acetyltransferase
MDAQRTDRLVTLREVDAGNWRACAALEVKEEQREFVLPVSYYLALCHYGGVWNPLAIYHGDEVVGFVMWAVDQSDKSGWIGGLTVAGALQGRGIGRVAVEVLLRRLSDEHGCISAALSYTPANVRARTLYALLGFEQTGEFEDDEPVARRTLQGGRTLQAGRTLQGGRTLQAGGTS